MELCMKKNLKMYLLIGKVILFYLFICVNMVYSEPEKNIERNRIVRLSFTPSSTFIVGNFLPKMEKKESTWVWSDRSIKVWSVENGDLIKAIPLESLEFPRGEFYPMTVSHDGALIAISFSSKEIGCYSLNENRWFWKIEWLKQERDIPQVIIFTPDDQKVIAVGEKHTVIYDAKSGNIQEIQEEPLSDYVLFFAMSTGGTLSPSGRYLAAWQREPTTHGDILKKVFMNKKITVWDVMKNQFVASWRKPKKNFCHAVFTPDEKSILFSSLDGYISEWSISEQKITREQIVGDGVLYYLTISPDGKFIAIESKTTQVWNYKTNTLLFDFGMIGMGMGVGAVCQSVYPMAFSPDSKYFALEKKGQLCLYETETWREKWCVPSYPEDKQAPKAD